MNLFSKAYTEALDELTRRLGGQLKHRARNDGWPSLVANSLNVKFDEGKIIASLSSEEHSATAFDLEYGTESTIGKATVRKMANSKEEQLNLFAQIFKEKVTK
jgi:hypothetical protein